MAETKIGGRDIKDSNVEAIDLNFASAEAMVLSATATGFVVWDRTASKSKEVRLSVVEDYFNTKYPLTGDSRINNGQTAFGWGNHAGLYSSLAHTHTFASITSRPTTLSGYGITDSYTKTQIDASLLTSSRNLIANNIYSSAISGYQYTKGRVLNGGNNRIYLSKSTTPNIMTPGYYSISFWYKIENYVSGVSVNIDINDQFMPTNISLANRAWTFYSGTIYVTQYINALGFLDMEGVFTATVTVSDIVVTRSSQPSQQYHPAPEDLLSYAPDNTVNSIGNITAPTFIGALSGNADTATNLLNTQGNWSSIGGLGNVVGMLAWKNYGNGHVIFDASQSLSPSGTAVNNANSQNAWAPQYPALMGWNGSNTYGVRVDSARISDTANYVNWVNVGSKPTTLSGYGITDTLTKEWVQSGSDFADGTLITTDIGASASEGDSFVLELSGKSYGGYAPFKVVMEGYLYGGTIINTAGISYGGVFSSYIKVMNNGGVLSFWFPRTGYWNSFNVHVRQSSGGNPSNRVTSIVNSVDPAGATKKISVTLVQTRNTVNFTAGTGPTNYTVGDDVRLSNERIDSTKLPLVGGTMSGNIHFANRGQGIVGNYASDKYQGVFAMGDAYKLTADGSTSGNLYGLAYTHSNVGGESKAGLSHQLLVMTNGQTATALGDGIWTRGHVTTLGNVYGVAATFASGVTAGEILSNANIGYKGTTQNSYIYFPDSGAHTGALYMQAGFGSALAGGSLSLFGQNHSTRAGSVSVGLTATSAKFTVQDIAFGNGTDLLSITRNGAATFSSSVTADSNITSTNGNFFASINKGYWINGGRFVYNNGTTYIGNIDNINPGSSTIIRSGGLDAITLLSTGAATFSSSVQAPFFTYQTIGVMGPATSNPSKGPLSLLYSAIAAGKPLYGDEEFAVGSNNINVYNNLGNGSVVHTREADASAPNRSGFRIKITYTPGTATPGLGGFILNMSARANVTLVQRFIAKIPVGCTVINAENTMGAGATFYWLTPQIGTGKWEEYIRVTSCGDTGPFSGGGHVYLVGPNVATTWFLASCNVYEVQSSGTLGIQDYQINDVTWAKVSARPTTLSGYGITDTPWTSYLPLAGGALTGGIIVGQSGTGANTYSVRGSGGDGYLRLDGGGGYDAGAYMWLQQSAPNTYINNNQAASRIYLRGGVSVGTSTDPGSGNLLVAGTGTFGTSVTALSFSGAGTGLTGTASAFNVGYATTAGTALPNNDSNLVHKAGAETISGEKTLTAVTRLGSQATYKTFLDGGMLLKDYSNNTLANGRIYFESGDFVFRGGGLGEADASGVSANLRVTGAGTFASSVTATTFNGNLVGTNCQVSNAVYFNGTSNYWNYDGSFGAIHTNGNLKVDGLATFLFSVKSGAPSGLNYTTAGQYGEYFASFRTTRLSVAADANIFYPIIAGSSIVTGQGYVNDFSFGMVRNTAANGYGAIRLAGDGIGTPAPMWKFNVDGSFISPGALGGTSANFSSSVTATAFYGPSDMRLKNLVSKTHNSSVSNIEEISYLWKDKSKGQGIQVGYSAQEVQKVMPNAVNTDDKGFLSVNYIQVLVAKVAELEKRLKQLEYGV